MFARIEHGFGKKLPLSILLRSPTVSQLAAAIDEAGDAGSQSALAPIQPHGTKRPLFCVAGIGGSVLGLGVLGQYLGEDQPLYGLRLHPSDPRSYPTVERGPRAISTRFSPSHRTDRTPWRATRRAGSSRSRSPGNCVRAVTSSRCWPCSIRVQQSPEPTLPFGFSWMVDFSRNLPYWFIDDFLHAEHGEMIGRLRSKARVCWGTIRRTFGGSRRQAESVDIRDVVGMWQAPEESRQRLQVEYAALENYTPEALRRSAHPVSSARPPAVSSLRTRPWMVRSRDHRGRHGRTRLARHHAARSICQGRRRSAEALSRSAGTEAV